ncbi:hypothetical protein HYX19_01725 [Candidatus Woesearchaeota archaeon]|nr:hypothetical protein [Candidatus Woesearchaeota archaeon]
MDKYQQMIDEAYENIAIKKYKERHRKEVKRKIKSGLEYIIANYNPLIGLLPGKYQEKHKERSKELNPVAASISSAIILGLGAYFVGQHLNSFDLGFSVGQMDNINGVTSLKPLYYSFLGGGLSEKTTRILSYYFMIETIPRIAISALRKKAFGTTILEFANYLKDRLTFDKAYDKETKKEINNLRKKNRIKDYLISQDER